MKNCIILGFGRSGTSLMGGILHHSGYFMGDDLYPSRESNPLGFFENAVINGINEAILARYDYSRIAGTEIPVEQVASPHYPAYGQRWLSYIEPATQINYLDEDIASAIRDAVAVPVFAYKDPRFSYTLPVWKKFFNGEVVKICMFRHPGATAESVVKDVKSADYLADFKIDTEMIFRLWYNCYSRVLTYLSSPDREKILFVHYEQLLSKEALPRISGHLGLHLKDEFVSPELNRSRAKESAPGFTMDLYEQLCLLSGFAQGEFK